MTKATKTSNFFPTIEIKKTINDLNTLDFGIANLKFLKGRGGLTVTLMLYPNSREITSENFKILPYEEYVAEITEGRRTTYGTINDFSDKFFGILLAAAIFVVFRLLQADQSLSSEMVISIIGGYIAGKELWSDIDDWLQKTTKNWFFSWKDRDFYYQKLDFGSIQNYIRYVRNMRYGSDFVLPFNIDFINQSNSKILELCYSKKDLKSVSKDYTRLASLEYQSKSKKDFVEGNYMLAVKLGSIRSFLGIKLIYEYFQSKNGNSVGCLDAHKKWFENKAMLRKSIKIGNLKIYFSSKVVNIKMF